MRARVGRLALLLAFLAPAACRQGEAARNGATVAPSGAHYAHLFGQRYRTVVDLYLFAFRDGPDYRYLGANDGRSVLWSTKLPAAVRAEEVGRTVGDIEILDVVPAGSELTLVAETHEVTALSGIRDKGGYPMGFISVVDYKGRREEGVLAEFIQAGEAAPEGVPNQAIDERIATRNAAPTELTAALVDGVSIDLSWKDNATGEAGYFVEGYFAAPDQATSNDFFVICALPPDSTHFRHANLLPDTTFVYRVRPFFGDSSNVAMITTGKDGPPATAGARTARTATASRPRPAPSASAPDQASLRSSVSAAQAAPSDLKATLIPPAGVRLEWRDRARDEDEYLVEIKPEWDPDFKPSAFLERDATSLTSYDFPYDTTFSFRVRAFFYGEPSNEATKTTGPEPSSGDAHKTR